MVDMTSNDLEQRSSIHSFWYYQSILPARRYASADLCESNVSVCPSVCPSVCHTPVAV